MGWGWYEWRGVTSLAAEGDKVRIGSASRATEMSDMLCDEVNGTLMDALSCWSNKRAYGPDAVEANSMWPSSGSCIVMGEDRVDSASFMAKRRSWKAHGPSQMVLSRSDSPALSDGEYVISASKREAHSVRDMKVIC